jgi:hypothetical protein
VTGWIVAGILYALGILMMASSINDYTGGLELWTPKGVAVSALWPFALII